MNYHGDGAPLAMADDGRSAAIVLLKFLICWIIYLKAEMRLLRSRKDIRFRVANIYDAC